MPTVYLPGDGPLHRWHPFTTLSLALAGVLLAFVPWLRHGLWPVPLLLGLAVASLARYDGPRTLRLWVGRLALTLGPLVLSLVLVQGLFYPGASERLPLLGPLTLSPLGIRFALTLSVRLLVILAAFTLTLLVTHPADLAHALGRVGLSHTLAYLVVSTLNLLPTTRARLERILTAQRARGLRLTGGPLGRVRALLPLLGPLLLGSLNDLELRAVALEARAFRTPGPKTSLRERPDPVGERALRRVLVGVSVVALVVGHLWG